MIDVLTFVGIYVLSFYHCELMDEKAGIEGSYLKYIPVLNTLLLLLTIILGWIWEFIDWIRK